MPFEYRRLDLDLANFEATARRLRYDALPDDVCVKHTANDRAETVLLNPSVAPACRHCGSDGSGPPPISTPAGHAGGGVRRGRRAALRPNQRRHGDDQETPSVTALTEIAEVFEADPVPLLTVTPTSWPMRWR